MVAFNNQHQEPDPPKVRIFTLADFFTEEEFRKLMNLIREHIGKAPVHHIIVRFIESHPTILSKLNPELIDLDYFAYFVEAAFFELLEEEAKAPKKQSTDEPADPSNN